MKNTVRSLLLWSEKYAKTDMLYLAKGSFWITLGHILSSLLSLVVIVAFANLLPKETYGQYQYILSLAGVLNIFTLSGMNSAVARSVAVGDDGVFRTSVIYQLKWNLLMFGAFLLLSIYYFLNSDPLFALSFLVLGIFVPATYAFNTYGAYLDGKKKFKFASIATSVSTLVYVLGLLAAITLSGEVLWLIIAYTLTTFISTLFFYLLVLKSFSPKKTRADDTLRYGRNLTFISFITPIAAQVDKILLTHFWGPAQLAVYVLATAIPLRVTGMIKNLVAVGSPKFASRTPQELNAIFYKRIFQGMLFGSVTTLLYIFIAPYFFKYILPQYSDSVFYSQILSLGFVFAIPNRYVSLLLVSQKFSRLILKNNIIQNLLKIVLYISLGIYGGILGLVIANVSLTFFGMLTNIIIWRTGSRTPTT